VGDSYFQHKSFDRIRSFKAAGTSIILVTHSVGDVRSLCDRAILLDKGHVLKDGPPDEVVDYYNALIATKENAKLTIEQRREKDEWLYSRSGTKAVAVESVSLIDSDSGDPIKTAISGQSMTVRARIVAKEDIPELVIGFMLKDRAGHTVWGTNTWHTGQVLSNLTAGDKVECRLRLSCALGQGSYGLSVSLHTGDVHIDNNFDWIENVEVFDVINSDRPFFIGTSRLEHAFEIVR
ncbi:ABC transporter ATP-binding protein, partial [Mesorhizobium sp. M4B.F.Ca.ET.088.02.2.1]